MSSRTSPSIDLTERDAEARRIIHEASEIIAAHGLAALSFRDLALAIGKSTTVIVNLFQSKSGLLKAVIATAIEEDEAFHQEFFAEIEGLAIGHAALIGLLRRYVRLRTSDRVRSARIWEECLVGAGLDPAHIALMANWQAGREAAWDRYLSGRFQFAGLARVLVAYLIMEEFYAGALQNRTDYDVIASESLAGLVDHVMGRPDEPAVAADWFLDRVAIPKPPADSLDPASVKLRLLDIAADQILSSGIDNVTNRSVSQIAGTSTSTIPYHFGDMRRFLMDAVWHSVFREMPRYLDHRQPMEIDGPKTVEIWAERMAPTLASGQGGAGFYVKYARLIAQICLKARRDPAFVDLAMILRGPEGGGTYTRRDTWPPQLDLTRLAAARFALWIKGRALLDAGLNLPATPRDSLLEAVEVLIATRNT